MLTVILVLFSIGLGAVIVGIRYFRWGDLTNSSKVTGAGIIVLLFGFALLLMSLMSSNKNIWWGSGCPMANWRAGMC